MANSLYSELKEHFNIQKYTDITLKITESENTAPPVEIKAHRITLAINSPFFKRLIEEKEVNKEGTEELEVKVKTGESQHVKTIVSSFYDKSVIPSLSIPDLISVLELSLSFAYTGINLVDEICESLSKLDPDFTISNLGLQGVYLLEQNEEQIMEQRLVVKSEVKARLTKFLSSYFLPLEERVQTHTDFMALRYGSLWCLLDSDCTFVCSENALLTFVLEWFKHDPERQTSDNIEGLLKKIRVKYLNGTFLLEVITLKNEIFCKWDGFHEWMCDYIGYILRTVDERKHLEDMDNAECRSRDLHAWFKEGKVPSAVRWMVRMSPVEESKRFEPIPQLLVRDRIKFHPESITITPTKDAESNTYNMNLKLVSSFSMLGLRFVLGIVPADRDYDMSKMIFNSNFVVSYLSWTRSNTKDSTSLEYSFWCASKEFVDLANQSGLYVCLLPVTEEEYKELSSLYNQYDLRTFQFSNDFVIKKINLIPSDNYSV